MKKTTVYTLKNIEDFEFPAKIISGGRITIPEEIRDAYFLSEGDLLSVKVAVLKKTPTIEMYLFDETRVVKDKSTLVDIAVKKLRLASFYIGKLAFPIHISINEVVSYKVNSNCAFLLLGVKFVEGKGWGTYNISHGSLPLYNFKKPNIKHRVEGTIFGKAIFYPDDVIKIKQIDGVGDIDIELLGLALTPHTLKTPFEKYELT